MTPRSGATWLPSALLLLQVPGCLSLSCPRRVTGTVGGSLSVQCRYEKKYTDHNKYWCKGPWLPSLTKKTVETTESEREVRSGRVSIRDHPATLTFTVTLESLTERDEGTYWCGMDRPGTEEPFIPTFPVVVSVSPATGGNPEEPLKIPPSGRRGKVITWRSAPILKIVTSTLAPPSTLGPPSSLPVTTGRSMTSQESPDANQHPRSLLSSVHFLLLIFLKVPLFLSMLSAVLWVNRPQRATCEETQFGEDSLPLSPPIHVLSRDTATRATEDGTSTMNLTSLFSLSPET